jgi:nitric oxide dioxygenase
MVHHTLNEHEEAVLKKSAHDLMSKGPAITSHMFDHFFTEHPDMKPYFASCFLHKTMDENHDRPTSLLSKAMAHIFFSFVAHIHDIDKFDKDMERISYKHVSRGIKPEFYPYLGDSLVEALEDVLGEHNTDLLNSWRHAYDVMAEIFIEDEERIRKDLRENPLTWEDYRKFKVAEIKEEEIEDVLSEVDTDLDEDEKAMIHEEDEEEGYHKKIHFYLEPVDGNPHMPPHKHGQYVSAKFEMEDGVTHRNYTLETIDDHRIVLSTKDIDPAPTSEYMRTHWKPGFVVEISAPMGEFLLLESLEVN